jgi:hypothetical protein
MPEESELTLALDGGIVTTALEDIIQPPNLKESDNTRLSVVRGTVTAAPAPEHLDTVLAGEECGGIIPAGRVDSTVAFFSKGGGDTRRIAGDDLTVLQSILQPPATQNAYRPTEIARAGVISGVLEFRTPVLCVHNGLRVFASFRYTTVANEVGVFITALDDTGRVVVTPQLAFTVGVEGSPFILISTLWLALTSHGASGMRAWYTRAGQVRRRTLTITGLQLTTGSEVTHSTTLGVAPVLMDVCAGVGDTAFLLHNDAANTATYLDKTDVVADTYTRVTLANRALGPVSVSHYNGATHPYVAVGYRESGGNWFQAAFRADTFAAVFQQAVTAAGVVSGSSLFETAVQFLVEPAGTEYVVFAITKRGTISSIGSGADDPSFIIFQAVELLTGVLSADVKRYWLRLADRGATVALTSLERLPFFTLSRDYEFGSSADLDHPGFIPDPSRELYNVVRGVPGRLHMTPVARFGVDIAVRSRVPPNIGPNTAAVFGKRVVTVYQTETFEYGTASYGNVSRFVEIDFSPKQPRYMLDSGGVALIASAQPATWDGREVVEAGPLHQPKIRGYDQGGTGDDMVGVYLFRALVTWRDAAGQVHRCGPTLQYKTSEGTIGTPIHPRLYVTVPDTSRDGVSQEKYTITLYQAGPIVTGDPDATPADTFFSRIDYTPVDDGVTWAFTDLDDDPNPNFAQTVLYTTGAGDEELPAEAPPPLLDGAMVGMRAWAIHGELRRRAVCTKKRVDGIALEWNGNLFVDVPAAAGNLVAVVELDGKPLFFGDRGVYTIDGDGPDNTGDVNSGSFGDPRCIAQVECSSRESVTRFPGGVMFLSGKRFAIMSSGGGFQYVDEIDASVVTSICAGVALPNQQELVIAPRTADVARAYVYNYALNRWTRWSAWPLFGAFALVSPTRAIGYETVGHQIVLIDVDESGATTIVQETGHIQPAGPQGSCTIHELILQGVWYAGFTLKVEAWQDFNPDLAFTGTYSSDELLKACDGKSRFTLRVALDQPISRAIKVRLTAVSSSSAAVPWQPVALTIPTGLTPGQLRRHVAAGMK